MELNTGWAEILAAVLGLAGSGAGAVLWFLFQSVRVEAKSAKHQVSVLKDEVKKDADELKKDLANYKLHVATHYVTQTDLTQSISRLERSIERLIETVDRNSQETRETISQLYDRLDKKADK